MNPALREDVPYRAGSGLEVLASAGTLQIDDIIEDKVPLVESIGPREPDRAAAVFFQALATSPDSFEAFYLCSSHPFLKNLLCCHPAKAADSPVTFPRDEFRSTNGSPAGKVCVHS